MKMFDFVSVGGRRGLMSATLESGGMRPTFFMKFEYKIWMKFGCKYYAKIFGKIRFGCKLLQIFCRITVQILV